MKKQTSKKAQKPPLNKGDVSSSAKQNDIKEMILAEYKKGNIVVLTFEGLQVAPLKKSLNSRLMGFFMNLTKIKLGY